MSFGTGSPVGVVMPKSVGEEYYDFAAKQKWTAFDLSSAAWELPASEAAVAPSTFKLTDSAQVAILAVPLADGEMAGGDVDVLVRCSDGTDHQACKFHFEWSAVNKGGTVTADVSPLDVMPLAKSSGGSTLAADIVAVVATNLLTFKIVASGSLGPTATTFTATVTSRPL